MDLGELVQVCSAFGISLDALIGGRQGRFLFSGRFVGGDDLPLTDWLTGMSAQLEQIASAKYAVFVFRAEDIPTFHFFQVPELTQFKLFFWRRTRRPASVGHRATDWYVIIAFLAIGISGYLVEALRIVWQQPTGIATHCSPVGLWTSHWFAGMTAASARFAHQVFRKRNYPVTGFHPRLVNAGVVWVIGTAEDCHLPFREVDVGDFNIQQFAAPESKKAEPGNNEAVPCPREFVSPWILRRILVYDLNDSLDDVSR